MTQAPGRRVVLAGYAGDRFARERRVAVARVHRDGRLDTSFGADGRATTRFSGHSADWVAGADVGRRGSVALAVESCLPPFRCRLGVARFRRDGRLDTSFSDDGRRLLIFGTTRSDAHDVTVDRRDRIIAVGSANHRRTHADFAIARLRSAPAGHGHASGATVLGQVTCPVARLSDPHARGCGSVAAYRGWVVWTSYDAAALGYVLWANFRGVTRQLPVKPAAEPFDVDLGPDATGRPVAVFSRCLESKPRCTLRNLDLATGKLTLLITHPGTEPLRPSRWGRRLAIVRSWWNTWRDAEICRLRGQVALCRPVRGGPLGAAPRAPSTGPASVELSARRMAIAWRWRPRGGGAHSQRTAILLRREVGRREDRDNRPRRMATTGGAGDRIQAVHTPLLAGGALYYMRGYARCGAAPATTLVRYALKTGRVERRTVPDVAGMAVSGDTLIQVRCADFVTNGVTMTAPVRALPRP
jgi:hypothetical protein